MKHKYRKIIKEWKDASLKEVWTGIIDNFIYGFLGAILVVFISSHKDIPVFIAYLSYYFFVGKIINRPKYVTDLGKLVVFPIPSAIGAFTGYKITTLLISVI